VHAESTLADKMLATASIGARHRCLIGIP